MKKKNGLGGYGIKLSQIFRVKCKWPLYRNNFGAGSVRSHCYSWLQMPLSTFTKGQASPITELVSSGSPKSVTSPQLLIPYLCCQLLLMDVQFAVTVLRCKKHPWGPGIAPWWVWFRCQRQMPLHHQLLKDVFCCREAASPEPFGPSST